MTAAPKVLIISVKENTHTKKPSSILFLLWLGSLRFFSKELVIFPRRQKRDQANAELIEGPGNCSRTLLCSAERTETSELQGLMGGAGGRTPLAGGSRLCHTHTSGYFPGLHQDPSWLLLANHLSLPKFPSHWIIFTGGSNEKKNFFFNKAVSLL